MALLDTTVLIDLGRRPESPLHQRVRGPLVRALAAGETLFTSRISEAEFRVGPERSSDRAKELATVERVLAGLVVLEFDAEACRRYARVKAALLAAGRPTGDCDTLIASTALANGERLVTRNPKHFADIPGLAVESY